MRRRLWLGTRSGRCTRPGGPGAGGSPGGVPLPLARLPPASAFCVAEIGMNNPGEIEPLARMAAPHVAVITTIAAAHIGHLGSMEAIADEKASILRGLEP